MWTGRWWREVQVQVIVRGFCAHNTYQWMTFQSLLPKGSALAPVIISTDKTQLTQFSGNKSAYPVYMTLGNIPKELRRKPSEHACVLIGYLSVDKIDSTGLSDRKHRALVQQLFHKSVQIILEPLIEAGKEGIDVTGGDGKVRRVHPVLAAYVADYPEQCLVTCSKYGTCPICQCPESSLGEATVRSSRTRMWTLDVLRLSKSKGKKGSNAFITACQNLDVSGYVVKPFWKKHTLADIHLSITPDVLHQLYQGVFKHILEWCSEVMDEGELDQRIRCLPPAYGTRHFKNGISALSQVSGRERKDIARILLGCLVGRIPNALMLTFRSLLDFIYISQYATHDDQTLTYLEDALKTYHANKSILKTLHIREHLNIPKFHSLVHYVDSIKRLGTTDNYNTEMFERLHIDCAKKAWRASNHKNVRPQMTKWLERREKIAMFETLCAQLHTKSSDAGADSDDSDGSNDSDSHSSPSTSSSSPVRPSASPPKTGLFLPKHPSAARQSIHTITDHHLAPGFAKALNQHIYSMKLGRPLTAHEQENATSYLPFSRLDVFHTLKFSTISLTDDIAERDVIKARPAIGSEPARFDTAIILQGDDAEATGVQGKYIIASLISQEPTNANFINRCACRPSQSHFHATANYLRTWKPQRNKCPCGVERPRPSGICGVVRKPPCICRPRTYDVRGTQAAPTCGWHTSWGDHPSQHD